MAETTASAILANDSSSNERASPHIKRRWPDNLLQYSAISWFLATAIGQWIFVSYIAAHYIPVLAQNGMLGFKNTSLPNGYVAGDIVGNLSIIFHVLIAIFIIGSGPLQLTPSIRNKFPTFHRYVGRGYIAFAAVTSIAGLYLVWTRGVPGGMIGHVGISLDAILIITFGALAIKHAMRRQFVKHRIWAMRLFMVVSAVWFFRIGLMFWFLTTGGIGIDPDTFEGPFLTFMFFGQIGIPLLILEAYFYAQNNKNTVVQSLVSFIIIASTIVTVLGVFAATMGMWFPQL